MILNENFSNQKWRKEINAYTTIRGHNIFVCLQVMQWWKMTTFSQLTNYCDVEYALYWKIWLSFRSVFVNEIQYFSTTFLFFVRKIWYNEIEFHESVILLTKKLFQILYSSTTYIVFEAIKSLNEWYFSSIVLIMYFTVCK